jgi:hypothetical protein|tara:strand:- start:1115 stop:1294 length:180 start_codon:yes stop_codon:yes gene_type:complete
MKAKVDTILKKYVSRKLMVFVVASFGLFSGTLTSSDWVIIAAVYISAQGAIDAIAKLRQ